MKIVTNHTDAEAVERFVAVQPRAAQGHRPVWLNILRHGMAHRPVSLTGWRDGQVVGYLPLVETRSIVFGRHLVSLPYLNEAGVLAADDATAIALTERAGELGRQHRARFVELRNRQPIAHDALNAIRTDKVRMVLDLPDDDDGLWSSIGPKVRNQIRKGEKHNLNVRWGGGELLDAFYGVFAVNMRDLGSPAFPKKLFAAMLHHLGNDAELCVIDLDGKPIAAAVLTHFGPVTEVPSASSLRSFNHTCANMLLYWHLLRRAIQRGARQFDFGRSTVDSGTYRFKKQWRAEARPTGWQQFPLHRNARPITADDDRFDLAVRLWQKLPVWFTRLAGPPIVRGIP